MIDVEKYMLARSKAGHDKDKVYLIMDYDELYVYLCDGDLRPLDKLKKKKHKHVQIIKEKQDIKEASNEKIKRAIKLYLEKINKRNL